MANYADDDFEVLYPGVYTQREKALAEEFLAANDALNTQRPFDPDALAAGASPAPVGVIATQPVTEAMVRYNSEKFDPENKLLHDAGYARSLGYKDIIAMPCFGTHDDTFHLPWPPQSRDTLMPSQLQYSVTSHKPVYPGDMLYLVADSRHVTERTPLEGSAYRTIVIRTEGSVYNQHGEKVNDMTLSLCESVRSFKEGKRPAKIGFAEIWDAPDWAARPQHYYTDEDWDFIRGIWAAEKRQGAEPLYWEDVRLGDRPAWTADGPIEVSVLPAPVYGMGIGGSRTMKREIMDPAIFATMVRGEKDGVYRLPDRRAYVPEVPDGAKPMMMVGDEESPEGAVDTANIHAEGIGRTPLINHHGRDIAIRHINNWMGDHGWLSHILWGIMPAETMAAAGKPVPKDLGATDFLAPVPDMQGRRVEVHGLTGDLAIVKSYVYDKYVRDREFFAELAFWIENIEGQVWLAGGTTVRLPSMKRNDTRSGR